MGKRSWKSFETTWTSATWTHATFLEIIRLYFPVSWEAEATLAVASVVGGRREAMHSLGAVQFIGIGTIKDDHKPPCWRCVVRARNALYVFIEAEHNIRPWLSTT